MSTHDHYIITVVGLGKIGLPLAVQYASKGFKVYGVDINEDLINTVNDGRVPFPGEKDLDWKLQDVIDRGLLTACRNTSDAVSQSNVVVVVVPLFVDSNGIPDFRAMDSATELIGKGLRKGCLITYETTLPVGTTRNRFTKILERNSSLTANGDFYVAFSPERVLTGRVFEDLRKYPKLVGGLNPESEQIAVDFYLSVLDFEERKDLVRANGVWALGSTEASEFAKLAETTYRDVNIALANQFALFAESNNLDVRKVIDASNSQPYSYIHQPGIAVGGHCIPIYPQMYLWNDPTASIVRIAREVNSNMPSKCVDKLETMHGCLKGERVVVLGASYRGGVKETAFSGVFPVVHQLMKRGALVSVHDPMYLEDELESMGLRAFNFMDPVDAIVVQANHNLYSKLTKQDFLGVRSVLDGRGILNEANWEGVNFQVIGRG